MTRNELASLLSQIGVTGAINEGIFDNLLATLSDYSDPTTPLQREIAIYGDSRTAMCHTITANAAYATENYGYAFWACSRSGVAFCPYTNNFGVGGDTTAQMLARISPVVASTAQVVLFMGGTNDRTGGLTVADTKRNITAIVRRLHKAGKIVIVANDTPRFGAKALTAPQQADHITIRDWVTNELSKLVPVVDTYSLITPADLNDELHPNVKGAYKIGGAFATALKKLLKAPADLPVEALDSYSVNNTTGSLIANPLVTGSVSMSTASVNPIAGGFIATGYKSAGSSFTGVTTKWAKETAAVGEAQLITLGGTPTASGAYLTFTPTATFTLANLSVGQVISMFGAFEIVGDGAGILGVTAELVVTKPVGGTSTTIYYRDGDKYQDPFGMPANASGVLETQRYTFDGTETAIVPRISIYLAQNVAQSATVKLKQIAVRKHVA